MTDSTYCVNKTTLCSGNNDADRTSEEVLNSLNWQILLNWSIYGNFLCPRFLKERNLANLHKLVTFHNKY
jgi:hypothetical protein